MKHKNTKTWAAAGAMVLLAACGSLNVPTSSEQGTGNTNDSNTSSGRTSSGADCGNANNGSPTNPNTGVANNPNGLDPNAFQYAYHEQGYGAFIFTTDPNACDTGSLILKANQPTLSTSPESVHGDVSNPGTGFMLNTTSPARFGTCYLYGGDPNNVNQVSGGITHEDSGPDFLLAEYALKIGALSANVVENANFAGPNVTVKECNFVSTYPGSTLDRDPNVLVPCK